MPTNCQNVFASFSLQNIYSGVQVITGAVRMNGFSASLGLGSGSSQIDIDLVYNPCDNDIPTFPTTGDPVFFSCSAGFSFGGIVNRKSYRESSGGIQYKFKIIDPRRILENVSLLLKDYYCPTVNGLTPTNFINVASILEAGVAVCPPGIDTQNWPRIGNCANFGNSGGENGTLIRNALAAIQGAAPIVYTTSGAPLYLDLTQVINITPAYARTTETNPSLLSLITQACEEGACDFFVTLTNNGYITVNIIPRFIDLPIGAIDSIIAQSQATGTLLEGEIGYEEIYDKSNKIILGDQVSYMSRVQTRGTAALMMGLNQNGTPNRVYGTNFTFPLDLRPIANIVGGFPNEFLVSEEEILCASTQNLWMLYGQCVNPNSLSALAWNILGLPAVPGLLQAYNNLLNPNITPDQWNKSLTTITSITSKVATVAALSVYESVYRWFNEFISAWYGKKWLIPINNFCINPGVPLPNKVGEGGYYYMSDVPVEAAFPSLDNNGSFLGLRYKIDTTILETSDGRLNGFLVTPLNEKLTRTINQKPVDFILSLSDSSLGDTDFFIKDNFLYTKINTDGTVWFNPNTAQAEVQVDTHGIIGMQPDFGKNLVNDGLKALAALLGPQNFTVAQQKARGYADTTSININKLGIATAGFDFAAVPMKSNVYVYGPWLGSKGSIGSTGVEKLPYLNPWNFGGDYGLMNAVGQQMALDGLRITNIKEAGSLTLAEPPAYSVGYFVSGAGLFVDSINVQYGSGGVTTSYNFESYTAKFGQFNKALSDSIQNTIKQRNEILNTLRDQRRKNIGLANQVRREIALKLRKLNINAAAGGQAAPQNNKSPGFLLVGGYYDVNLINDNFTKTYFGSGSSCYPSHTPGGGETGGRQWSPASKLSKLSCQDICSFTPTTLPEPEIGETSKSRLYEVGIQNKHEINISATNEFFNNLAIMSLDAVFSPVSISGRGSKLPRYGSFDYSSYVVTSKTRPSMPPINGHSRLEITQKYLNPILSKSLLAGWDGRGQSESFNILVIGFGDDVGAIFDTAENKYDNQEDFGFYALRGPLVLQSWGYDTENKPIPNIVDSPHEAEKGKFQNGAKNKFMTNWLQNPGSWPVGPIDLRWDRHRGVWVAPPQDRIVVAQLLKDLEPLGSAEAVLLNPEASGGNFYDNYAIYGSNGEDIGSNLKSAKITVYDFLNRKLCTGTRVYASYNDTKYIVLESSVVNETTCDCVCSSSETSTTTTTTTTTEPCTNDPCGISQCLKGLGDGVLGIKNGCITIYETTECSTSQPPY